MERGLTPRGRGAVASLLRRSSARAGCSARAAIAGTSTMPMISPTSRTTMSWPFLSSAARSGDHARSFGDRSCVPPARSEPSVVRRMELTSTWWRSASVATQIAPTRWVPSTTSRPGHRGQCEGRQCPSPLAADDACGSSRRKGPSPPSVETACSQHPRRRRRYEEVDGFTRGRCGASLRSTIRSGTACEPTERRGAAAAATRDILTVDDGEVCPVRTSSARYQVSTGATSLPTIRNSSPDGVSRRSASTVSIVYVGPAFDLEAGSRRSLRAPNRSRRGHLEPGLGRRARATALLPRIARHHDEHPAELELAPRGRGRGEMRDVHGVESAAENTEALHSASVRKSARERRVAYSGPRPARRNLPLVPSLDVARLAAGSPWCARPGRVSSERSAATSSASSLERSENVAVDEVRRRAPDQGSRALLAARSRRSTVRRSKNSEFATFRDPASALESVGTSRAMRAELAATGRKRARRVRGRLGCALARRRRGGNVGRGGSGSLGAGSTRNRHRGITDRRRRRLGTGRSRGRTVSGGRRGSARRARRPSVPT